ncbi:HNH endonuclease family protein [Aquiflexum sp.]|uniref:HNH endonuclease family protein n=1 Tax=Aquiflexum sp. TaxID=1872584 RepID=UPI0035940FB8
MGEFSYAYGPIETAEFDDDEEQLENEIESVEKSEYDSKGRMDILEFIGKILEAAKCYSKIWYLKFSDKKINQRIADLQDIKSFPSYIFLMHYLQKDMPKKDQYLVLEMIGVTMLRRHVTGQSTAYNDDIFSKLLRVRFEENHVQEIRNLLMEDTPTDDEFLDSFSRHELKQRVINRARYMLTKIEYFKRKGTSEISINGADDVHVEHIIPQTIDTKTSKNDFGDWEKYLGEKAKINHKKFVNRIGNMTLLASSLNISASNNPFAKKKGSYKTSELFITRELAELRDFKFSHVDKRGQDLAQIAIKIWKL